MLNEFKNLFRGGNFIWQIIVLNAVLFVVFNLVTNIPSQAGFVNSWLALPPFLGDVLVKPWTLISYMFMHANLRHIIYNMIVFYVFARIFRELMGNKRLMGLYFLGGLAGGLFFVAVYSLMLLGGEAINNFPLVGASAAIMAVVAAVGLRFGNHTINLMFLGSVQIKYVALVIFVITTVLDLAVNFGGKMSHLGGAALGYFYVRGLDRGKDYALGFMNFFERLGKVFERKPRMRVVNEDPRQQRRSTGQATSGRTKEAATVFENQARMDAILDKISKSGYENLSKEEKEFLFKMSNKT